MKAPKISYKNEIYRKLIHISSLWMVVAVYLLDRTTAIYFFGFFLSVVVFFEIARRRKGFVQRLIKKIFGKVMRAHEAHTGGFNPSGAFYLSLSVFLCVMLFEKPVAMTALLIVILADTAAALVGRRWGRHKILGKSLEGSAAFFVTSAFVLAGAAGQGLDLGFLPVVLIALAITLIELFSPRLRLDDNLSITLGAGALISLFV